jgi:hypothetical protein
VGNHLPRSPLLARAKNILFNIGEEFHIWNKNGSLHPHRLEFISKIYKRQFIGSLAWVISSMTHRSWDRFVFHLKDKNLTFTRKGRVNLHIEHVKFEKKRANSPSGLKRRGAIRSRTRPGGSEEKVSVLAERPMLDEKSSTQIPVIQQPVRPGLERNTTVPIHFPIGWKEGRSHDTVPMIHTNQIPIFRVPPKVETVQVKDWFDEQEKAVQRNHIRDLIRLEVESFMARNNVIRPYQYGNSASGLKLDISEDDVKEYVIALFRNRSTVSTDRKTQIVKELNFLANMLHKARKPNPSKLEQSMLVDIPIRMDRLKDELYNS